MKNDDPIGNRTRDPPACTAVPQPAAPPPIVGRTVRAAYIEATEREPMDGGVNSSQASDSLTSCYLRLRSTSLKRLSLSKVIATNIPVNRMSRRIEAENREGR